MSKKPQQKRKTATLKPKQDETAPANVGSIAITVQFEAYVTGNTPFNELVIELGTLGLPDEPSHVTDRSANARLLDPKRPIEVSDEGLHMFFDPPLQGSGIYGFQLRCEYDQAVEARTAAPPEEKKEQYHATE